ncbi:MAG: amidohydrolase [Chitinophagales bacterium]|jgi:hypothetical protein|nr:amidohydrolase [Bacteroidota bacterium]MBP8915918.1 amidohydrolase [Chitinophagales bacterium]MBP9220233.1 amidohydrolase [Chitinophagales bacterium]MBP9794666.1 amidohydrolase [Chitinophagales bacterium]
MADKIFFNGKILTQDKQNPKASAFAIKNGKFIAVGDDKNILELKSPQTLLIDLHNKTVLPGFNDAHIHVWKVGNLLTSLLDLRGIKSLGEMQDKLKDYAHNNPQLEWILARGFNEALFPDKKMPDKFDLDKIITDRPVCITRTCAHQIIVNSKALEFCNIVTDTKVPQGGEIKLLPDGSLAGHFTETAIGLILSKIPKYNKIQLREMILAAQDKLIECGITAATDPAVEKDLIEVYKEMDRNGELKIRINIFPIRVPDGINKVYPLPEKYRSDLLNIDTVKFFADGGLSGKTAAMKKPYKNSNESGVLRIEKETFKKLALESQDAGFRIAVHAIGDSAIEMVLNVLEEIAPFNRSKINHRIEHVGFPSQYDLKRMADLNISAVMQPIFIYELGKNFRQNLSEEYLNKIYPVKSIIQRGINVAFSTDAPVVVNFDPLFNINSAMNRIDDRGNKLSADQKVTFEEGVFAYTMGSAIASGYSEKLGSIEINKYADFVVLQDEQKVYSTFVNGEQLIV